MSKAIRNIKPIPEYEVLIPCATVGYRMKQYGPKSLIELKPGLSIIDYQLKMLKKHLKGSYRIIMVTGFESQKLMNHTPSNIVHLENSDYENSSVIKSIGIGLRACTTKHIMIIYGDLLFNEYALKIPVGTESMLITAGKNTASKDEVGCTIHNHVEHMWYGLDHKWAQMLYLTGKELDLFKTLCWNSVNHKRFTFEILNEVIDKGGIIKALQPRKLKAIDIDEPKDLENARTMFKQEYSKF